MAKVYTFEISTDHGHTWKVSGVKSEVGTLRHVLSVLATSEQRYVPDTYPDRFVVRSHATGQEGWRWMWLLQA